MKERIIWLVIIVLLLSALPLALIFNYTGMAFIPPSLKEDSCPCVASDGVIVRQDSCYSGNDSSYISFYCEEDLIYNEDGTEYSSCSLVPSCNICGCPTNKVCNFNSDDGSYFCTFYTPSIPTSCVGGTFTETCSSVKPLYCENTVYSRRCDICGCSSGYVCGNDGSCLIDNILNNQTDSSSGLILWDNVNQTFNQTENSVSSRERNILLSGARVNSELVYTRDLDDIIGVDKNTLLLSENKIKENEKSLQALYLTNEISGELVKSVLSQASEPLLSPKGECVGYDQGSCIGIYECCSGFVCNDGVCVSNLNVKTENIDISLNERVLDNENSVSSLVEVKTDVNANLNAVKYDTHPNYVKENEIPNSVNFGFYEIEVDQPTDAELSFEVSNSVLMLNQIDSIGAYRLVSDQWEQLDLLDVEYSADKTIFTFKTGGFSYFEIIGTKDLPSILTVTQDTPLWAVYKQSYESGFSVVELSFQNKDKLSFGKISGVPFIDLGFNIF